MAPTRLEQTLLGLLAMEPKAGYDLVRIFETTPMGHFSGSPGAIYPALARLEEEGLLRSDMEGGGARPRRVYSVTDAGHARLDGWLRAPITVEAVRDDLDMILLRFSVAETHLDPEESVALLEELGSAIRGYLDQLHAEVEALRGGPYVNPVLALEHGIAALEATLAWIDEATGTLNERSRRART